MPRPACPKKPPNVRTEGAIHVDLLRHGEVAGGACYRGRTDDPLSPAGWEQMWAAVDQDSHWRAIVTSPLTRCSEFAHALAQRLSLPIRIDERLQEMDFGDWENRSATELLETEPERLTRFWQDPINNCPPNGEPFDAMRARVLNAWGDIVTHASTTLVIAHGGPIRIILCHCLGHPSDKLMDIDVPHAKLHRVRVQTRCDSGIQVS